MVALSWELTQTRDGLFSPAGAAADDEVEDPDDEFLRAALELVLDDAVALLESRPPSAEEERSGQDMETTEIRSLER